MRQDKRAAPKAPINENISAREVRLIGADGEQIGIVSIDEALKRVNTEWDALGHEPDLGENPVAYFVHIQSNLNH